MRDFLSFYSKNHPIGFPYSSASSWSSIGSIRRSRVERWKRGLTQVKLARKLGTTQAIVSSIETGGEVTNERVLEAVREFLEGEGNV
jgi:DNA-binding XRE family transcriptional regulator